MFHLLSLEELLIDRLCVCIGILTSVNKEI